MTISYKKFKDFEDKWVAIDERTESVVASGDSIGMVQKNAEKAVAGKKDTKIILEYIPAFHLHLAPHAL